MMRYLSLFEVLELHEAIISISGGSRGIRDINALESAINQPRITFDQTDLYPDIISKAGADRPDKKIDAEIYAIRLVFSL